MTELIIKEWKFEMKNEMNFSTTSLIFSIISTFDNDHKSNVLFLGSAEPRMCIKYP